jgi:hypothetical protein
MDQAQLKEQVRRAISSEWLGFASSHPRLAAVMDEMLLVDEATASLADDPEYRQVMDQAMAAGVAADVIGGVVQRYVRKWLGMLAG